MLTQKSLKEILYYHPESGDFIWLNPPKQKHRIGMQAGMFSMYQDINIEGKVYKAHRLAWFYIYGAWPIKEIDHKNGNKLDNRINNLRDVSRTLNAQNHIKKPKENGLPEGVRKNKRGKFDARIGFNNKSYFLGEYETPEEAGFIYKKKRMELHYCPAFKEEICQ